MCHDLKNSKSLDWPSFFALHSPRLRAQAMRRGVDSHDADDLSQEVLLAFYLAVRDGKITTLDGVKSWLRARMAWTLIGRYRSVRGRRGQKPEQLTNMRPLEAASTEDDPGRLAEINEAPQAAADAVQALPAEERDVIEWVYYEGGTVSSLAAKLKQPRSRLSRIYRRGQKRLRRWLSGVICFA